MLAELIRSAKEAIDIKNAYREAGLHKLEPIILIDTRERKPWRFTSATLSEKLETGDYTVAGCEHLVAVERKSLDDLVLCLTGDRERFERELTRGTRIPHFIVVVEASYADLWEGKYKSDATPSSMWGSVCAFQIRYGVSFIFAGSRTAGAKVCEDLLLAYWQQNLIKPLKAISATKRSN